MQRKIDFLSTLIKLCIFFICAHGCAIAFGPSKSAELEKSRLTAFVEDYCRSEYNCVRDFRVIHTKWSGIAKKEFRKYNDMEYGYFNVVNDPLFVVCKYSIKNMKIQGSSATVLIDYTVIAKTEKWGANREFVFNNFQMEETLIIVFKNNNFIVNDPPYPKISLTALINELEQSFGELYRIQNGGIEFQFPSDWPKNAPGIEFNKRSIRYLVQFKKMQCK